MKIQCHHCKKEITKYIFLDYKKGYKIDDKFKGQIKYFCSPLCIVRFIGETKEESKGFNKDFKLLTDSEWKIPECKLCKKRTDDCITINYDNGWKNDVMRVGHVRTSLCSVDCLKYYVSEFVEIPKTTEKDTIETLKQKSFLNFKLMIDYARKQNPKLRPDKYKMNNEIKTDWRLSEFDYCSRQDISCELCSLWEDETGCCNGFYKKMNNSQSWSEWIKNMIEVVKYFKENA